MNKVLPANAFTYPKRKFTGWNTKKDGSGRSYENGYRGDIYKDDGTIPEGGETITLYAQWDWGEIPEDIRKDIFESDMSKVKKDDIWYAFKYEDKNTGERQSLSRFIIAASVRKDLISYLKYLLSNPSSALPCLASSRAIS